MSSDMVFREETIGDCRLILSDCLEVLPTLPKPSAIVTDPPYGIGMQWQGVKRNGRKSGLKWGANASCIDRQPDWKNIIGDDAPFDPSPWLDFSEIIFWGGNNYPLPPARCWLIWDKRRDTTPDHHGDAELAWTNLDSVIRVHRQLWWGIVREGEENVANSPKYHPTQKPVALMKWCLGFIKADTIIDPYMGSGSTLVACAKLSRKGIGLELHEPYFDIACKRIEEAYRQADMFCELPPTPTMRQTAFSLDGEPPV
jgi:DNA modification methylase